MQTVSGEGRFDRPVTVYLSSVAIRVNNARQAAELLLYKWPVGETGRSISARMACMRVLGGGSPASVARGAFLRAASEAHILRH